MRVPFLSAFLSQPPPFPFRLFRLPFSDVHELFNQFRECSSPQLDLQGFKTDEQSPTSPPGTWMWMFSVHPKPNVRSIFNLLLGARNLDSSYGTLFSFPEIAAYGPFMTPTKKKDQATPWQSVSVSLLLVAVSSPFPPALPLDALLSTLCFS